MTTISDLYNATFPSGEFQSAINNQYGIDDATKAYNTFKELALQGYKITGGGASLQENEPVFENAYPTAYTEFYTLYAEFNNTNIDNYFDRYQENWNQATGLIGIHAHFSKIEWHLANNFTYNMVLMRWE